MSVKQIVDPGWGYEKAFGYSQGVKAGGLVTFAGQMPVDAQCNLVGEGDPSAQIRQVFENIKTVLAGGGLTFVDLVEIVSYHTDMEDLHARVEIMAEYITREFPGWPSH